jgi:uncharacterized protein (DUF427 family)
MNQQHSLEKESVWDYPRPPKVEAFTAEVVVEFNHQQIAKAPEGFRVLETSHPPVYFIHPDYVDKNCLFKRVRDIQCPYKGVIKFYDIVVGDERSEYGAWFIPKPNKGFELIKDHIAFFAHKVDACYVNGEQVTPQPGEFYGGWITSNIMGPYKGLPGTDNW